MGEKIQIKTYREKKRGEGADRDQREEERYGREITTRNISR